MVNSLGMKVTPPLKMMYVYIYILITFYSIFLRKFLLRKPKLSKLEVSERSSQVQPTDGSHMHGAPHTNGFFSETFKTRA